MYHESNIKALCILTYVICSVISDADIQVWSSCAFRAATLVKCYECNTNRVCEVYWIECLYIFLTADASGTDKKFGGLETEICKLMTYVRTGIRQSGNVGPSTTVVGTLP